MDNIPAPIIYRNRSLKFYLLIALVIIFSIFLISLFFLFFETTFPKSNIAGKSPNEPASGASSNSLDPGVKYADVVETTKTTQVLIKSTTTSSVTVEDPDKNVFRIPFTLISTSSAHLKFTKDKKMVLSIVMNKDNQIQKVYIISRR